MQKNPIRIGTRESRLAVWQANWVKDLLHNNGCEAELVYIKSEGDADQTTPLYAIGVQGVFTRSLDSALLNNKIDIAVHSLKDVPVQLAKGVVQVALLSRASHNDVLVRRKTSDKDLESPNLIIATGSVRRKAQWLHRYPATTFEPLRGNVPTRLKKIEESYWDGAIFAAAGLERIQLRPENSMDLDWMLPAPAQGAVAVFGRETDTAILEACAPLNDSNTATCVKVERDFLKALIGGCSVPVGALAEIRENEFFFKGNIVSPDGRNKSEIEQVFKKADAESIGKTAAEYILNNGGKIIIDHLRNDK